MKITDIARRAGRSLKNAKVRTLLTSLAIAVGAFTITLALAAGEGGRQYAEEIITSNTDVRELYVEPKQDEGADMSQPQVYSDDPTISFGGFFSVKTLQRTDLDKLEALDNVESVTPVYNVSARYVTRESADRYQTLVETFNPHIRQEYLAGSGESLAKDQAILPEKFLEALKFTNAEDAIGQTVDIAVAGSTPGSEDRHFTVEIVGVVKASIFTQFGGVPPLQVHAATASEMHVHNLQGTPQEHAFMGATVLANSEENVEALKEEINNMGYVAQTAEDALSFLFQFINVLMGILIGFGALAVLTSVFGIVNTQYISVLERTQQIGLMKALGARRRDISRLFKLEAAWIGFIGGVIGAGGAVLAGTLANPWISDQLTLGDTHLLIFAPWSVAAVVLGLTLVAVVSGILPAYKAAKLDPIEALRTE